MQPPITGQVVLGWDPAFRTGCKLAVVDPTGKYWERLSFIRLPRRLLQRSKHRKIY